MVVQLAIAVVLVAVVVSIAALLRRRRPSAPTQSHWEAPVQLDRSEFDRSDAPWLVVVFSSSTCHTCADMVHKSQVLASDAVAVQEVEAGASADLHRRYGIEAVPITVVADGDGVVRAAFIGPASATDLWAAVAELREPGSSPEPGLGRIDR
jgi:hypothetical protein